MLSSGARLGPYEVVALLGAGGMGEVYRARDTKLGRDVALKVLPEGFTADADRLARFEREAKVVASLNHPNIGHIYGLEEGNGQKALVLELLEEADELDQIEFSPDGRWVAYHADHGTGLQVYVMPCPPTGERIQVSSAGGVQPQWRPDGEGLFDLSLDGAMMAVSVDVADGFNPGKPRLLFQTGLTVDGQIEQYAVASDGQRFLVPTPVGPSTPSLALVQNWFSELERRVPVE